MVEKALAYPTKGSGKLRHVIGGSLLFFSWSLLPLFLLIGYYIQTLVFASTGQEDPPPFGHVISLSRLGAVGAVIVFTYAGFFIAGPMVILAYLAPAITSPASGAELSSVVNIFTITLGGFASIMALFLPVILCQYGRTGDFTTVYAVDDLFELIKTRAVLKAIIGTAFLTIGVIIATLLIAMITLGVGLLFTPFILFWYMMVTAYLYGRAIGTVTGTVSTVQYSDLVEEINAQGDGTGHSPDGS